MVIARVLYLDFLGKCTGISFIDSTRIHVYEYK